MDGRSFIRSLPQLPTDEREQSILDAVLDGHLAPIVWHTLTIKARGHEAQIDVSTALQLGETSPVRFNCRHTTAQRIADAIDQTEAGGAVLPTAKLVDEMWAAPASLHIGPCLQPSEPAVRKAKKYSPSMSDPEAMIRHHDDVENTMAATKASAGVDFSWPVPEGKNWVCTNKLTSHPELAANYGLQDPKAPYRAVTPAGGRVWQGGPGTAHTVGHTDYSQIVQLVRRMILVDGSVRDIEEVAKDPELCWLVSSEGTMAALRHPAVARPGAAPAPVVVTTPKPVFTRTLRRGCQPGIDVVAWQAIVGAKQDGIFGTVTESLTRTWQHAHGLTADGVVGPMTRQAAGIVGSGVANVVAPTPKLILPAGMALSEPSPLVYATNMAVNFTKAFRSVVHWLVIHVMQAPEKPSTADSVANWTAGKLGPPPRVSFHWAFDCDGAILCVPEEHVAWHANKANRFGVGYEHAGYSEQTRDEWLDDYSESTLWLSAQVAAKITMPRWDLPMDNFVNAAGLKKAYEYIDRGQPVPNEYRGITSHVEVTKGLGGTHTDPGKGFPLDVYLDWIKKAA